MKALRLILALPALALAATAGAAEQGTVVHHRMAFGTSVQGRPMTVMEAGDPAAKTKVMVVCCIHGDEQAGAEVVTELEEMHLPPDVDLWLVEDANPDGVARWTRGNAHGVDLNRNFAWRWHRHGKTTIHWTGPRPFSEPESRALSRLLLHVRPNVVIWYHQALDVVDESGGSLAVEQRYADLAGLPLRKLPRYGGSATSWVNRRLPGVTSFVVELPGGDLGTAPALRQASAVLVLAQGLAPRA
jgi:protein MpaA